MRLVEKDAAALAHDGELCEPAAEVRDVVLGYLYALGPARGARGENDVLGLLAGHPRLSREGLCRGVRGEKLASIKDISARQHASEGIGHVTSGQQRGTAYLASDIRETLGRQLNVQRNVGMATHETGEQALDREGTLGTEHEHGATTGNGREAASYGAGVVPHLGVGRRWLLSRTKRRGVWGRSRHILDRVKQYVHGSHAA